MKYMLLLLLLLPVSGFADDIDDERDRHHREQTLRNVDDADPEACSIFTADLARAREELSHCCPPIHSHSCLRCSEEQKEFLRKIEQYDCSEMKERKCPDYEDLCQDI